MVRRKIIRIVFTALMGQVLLIAQEKDSEINIEESAEVFLEEYSDDFEEAFFEALKQKGIENYDRAINLFLECKRLDDKNIVIDHELAKAYFLNKNYNLARDYGVAALISEPENSWYLNTLVEALEKQGSSIEDLDMGIFSDNLKLQQNLALIYYKKEKYEDALAVLKNLKKTTFLDDLTSKINDSIEKRNKISQKTTFSATVNNTSESTSSLNGYKGRIQSLIRTNNHMILKQVAADAAENFPSQPYFYYAQGYAFNKTGKHRDAIEVLEASLDYLVGDISLANKIYSELGEAYNGINNSVKANMYLRKVKPGF
ncbi:tetratricopeptide repeat protein [Maribacter sp. 2308TA10-17]|uniref:tetratricopeptide repeat protein n=1 Tax=Maribacter sp. 2308TA10-17 TaxID=3386276 RepID=UPI0039BD2BDA